MLLKGNGKGNFQSITATGSGFFVNGDVKDISVITLKDERYILIAINNDDLKSVKLQNQ